MRKQTRIPTLPTDRAAVEKLSGNEFETGTHTGTEKTVVSELLDSIGLKG